jgi:putative SOS response-associated peptidase YedK
LVYPFPHSTAGSLPPRTLSVLCDPFSETPPITSALFAFAGLWERWERGETAVEPCTIIVTEANDLTRPIHDRMPVILPGAKYELWLSTDSRQAEHLQNLLRPFPSELMPAYPVSTEVNNLRNDSERCIEQISEEQERGENEGAE